MVNHLAQEIAILQHNSVSTLLFSVVEREMEKRG